MATTEDTLTPAAKALQRTGRCVAIGCTYDCNVFAFDKRQDGFRLCLCGHTQHSHALPGA